MLDNIFLQIFNMSITSAIVIVFVLVARLALKKTPKIFSYILWSVVLFRLVCPFTFESVLSILPTKANPISQDIIYMQIPKIDTGIAIINEAVNRVLPQATPNASINPLQVWLFIGSIIWAIGVLAMVTHSIVALIKLRNRLKTATYYSENVFLSSKINTAIVIGLIRPRIYLPINLSHSQREHILLHEGTHIKRCDHIVKLISFFTLCVHWFNPLVWVAFFASGKDMEMACDESVIKHLGNDVKKDYSESLLTLATGKRLIAGTPLAFGEGDTKSRIKNVLSYKKPAFWVIIIAVIAVIALIVGLMSSPSKVPNEVKITQETTAVSINFPAYEQSTEYNDKVMNIKPFTLLMQLPLGWSVELRGDDNIKYPLMGAWTPLGIFNDKNEYVGAVGYNTYEEAEGAEDVPQAIYNQIALGNNYQFNAQIKGDTQGGDYDAIAKNEQGETAITTVYTAANISKEQGYNGEEIINKGILSYNKDMLVYIAIELDEKKISNEDLLAMAKSISLVSHEQTGEDIIPVKLDQAIHTAILEQNKNENRPAEVAAESHAVFAIEEEMQDDNSNTVKAVTVYTFVLYEEYNIVDGKMDATAPASGTHTPTAITFNVDKNGDYSLDEYWTPRGGDSYIADIESKFPDEIQAYALDNTAYITAQKQDNYTQLIVAGHLNATLMIESIIEDASKMEGDRQSNWRLNASLNELTYYGDYMLKYSFSEFLKGEQDGKKSEIMYNTIRELLQQANEDVSFGNKTGQAWFDSYFAHIQSYETKEGLFWVKENMPKAHILSSMKTENLYTF